MLLDHVLRADLMLTGLAINSLLFAATAVGFARLLASARRAGTLLQMGNRNRQETIGAAANPRFRRYRLLQPLVSAACSSTTMSRKQQEQVPTTLSPSLHNRFDVHASSRAIVQPDTL